jgi:hypothetical protein
MKEAHEIIVEVNGLIKRDSYVVQLRTHKLLNSVGVDPPRDRICRFSHPYPAARGRATSPSPFI